MDLKSRLLERREIDPQTGCWNWIGHWDKDGYGVIQYQRKKYRVHVVALRLFKGIRCFCAVHRFADCPLVCFNPEHLVGVQSFGELRRWHNKNRVTV